MLSCVCVSLEYERRRVLYMKALSRQAFFENASSETVHETSCANYDGQMQVYYRNYSWLQLIISYQNLEYASLCIYKIEAKIPKQTMRNRSKFVY